MQSLLDVFSHRTISMLSSTFLSFVEAEHAHDMMPHDSLSQTDVDIWMNSPLSAKAGYIALWMLPMHMTVS